MTRILTIASAVLALAGAVPAVHAETSDQTTVHVSYSDLNLGTIRGRQSLDQRVSRAIDRACGEHPMIADLDGMSVYQACQKAIRSNVDGQLKSVGRSVADLSAEVTAGR